MAAAKTHRSQIVIPAWLESPAGGSSLQAGEIQARIDGAAARVRAVRGPSDDLMLLVVADFTADLSLAESARQSVAAAVEGLPANAWAGLLRAQDGLKVLLDPTPDRKAFADAIQEVPVSGTPGLLETVETAARIADSILSRSGVRVAILYLSDSNIHSYREDYTNPVINWSDPHDLSRRFPEGLIKEKISKLEAALGGLQAPLFVVHLEYRGDRLNEAYQAGLLQLAASTGGGGEFCRSRGEIPEAIRKTLGRIAAHYSIVLEPPERAGRMVQIQLESAAGALNHRTRFLLEER